MKPRYSLAQELADKITINESFPIDLDKICNLFQINLIKKTVEGLSGAAIVEGAAKTILVNNSEPETRQRFTISHELGHLLLHKNENLNYSQVPVVLFRESTATAFQDWKEREANCFAANLLMPTKAIQVRIQELFQTEAIHEDVVEKLSNEFQVSVQAMSIRLSQLGFTFY
jgi:Zn-dependent peptidase ImmA (M78 family)